MRYLHRTHRISIAVLHELLTGKVDLSKTVTVEYTTSEKMAADIFTKGFSDKKKWDHAARAIGLVGKDEIVAAAAA